MKLNWKPSRVAWIDFETRSQSPLDTVHKFATHPSTQALTCVVKTDDGIVRKYGPFLDARAKDELAQIAEHHTLVAHNAPFDAAVWEHVLKLPGATWFDTLPCARAAGMPGGLDALSKIVTGRGKDPNGKRLVDMLCLPQRAYPPTDSPAYTLLMQYNLRDVEELEVVYHRVKDYVEPAVMTVDRVINDRGIPIDGEFLDRLKVLFEENKAIAGENFAKIAPGVNAGSPKQMVSWLKTKGFDVPGVSLFVQKTLKERPEEYFWGDDDSEAAAAYSAVEEAMNNRRDMVGVGAGKIDAAKQVLEADGRVREQLVYWGAHTGRWTGRKLQVHNMPRSVKGADTVNMPLNIAEVFAKAEEATKKLDFRVSAQDVLNSMLRHMVTCDNVLAADYGSVEAKCVAWLADEKQMLEIFADPTKSVYIDFGTKLFGRSMSKKDYSEYAFAKAVVLGCTYGMSGKKFEFMCKMRNVKVVALEEAGMTIADAVKRFRQTYPALPNLWNACAKAALTAVGQGAEMFAAKCRFSMKGGDMHITLPSGRNLVYRNARVELVVPSYCAMYGMPLVPVNTVVYDNPKGYKSFVYGSKLCLGANTTVVTRRGLSYIQDVEPGDEVWDGEEWVETDGPVCNGVQEVGEWLGVLMTPDHTIFDGGRWRPATAMGEDVTGCSLKWAASSVPSLLSSKSHIGAGSAVCAICAAACRRDRSDTSLTSVQMRVVSSARMQTAESEFGRNIQADRLCLAHCLGCGCIAGRASYRAATMRRASCTTPTVAGALRCIKRGSMITRSSSATRQRSEVGMLRHLTSIGSTTKAITSRVTSGSSLGGSAPIIADRQYTSNFGAKCIQPQIYSDNILTTYHTAHSSATSGGACWLGLRGSAKVYDLMNCGPRHRFMILTNRGPAVVSNCENISQAICRDMLAEALVAAEASGMNPIVHVHDEMVCEAPAHRLQEFVELMSARPKWAPDLPVLVEGYSGPLWTKQTSAFTEMVAVDGRALK